MTSEAGQAPSPYGFAGLQRADLPRLRQWLGSPEAARWWGDPDEQYGLIEEDLANPQMAQWIVSFEGRPFAYAQAYEVHAWPQAHLEFLPAGAMAIDAFIGEPEMIGRGHGGRFLRRLAQRLLAAGAPAVAIDPDVENLRARRAYARAGFTGDTVVETPEGPAVLMMFRP